MQNPQSIQNCKNFLLYKTLDSVYKSLNKEKFFSAKKEYSNFVQQECDLIKYIQDNFYSDFKTNLSLLKEEFKKDSLLCFEKFINNHFMPKIAKVVFERNKKEFLEKIDSLYSIHENKCKALIQVQKENDSLIEETNELLGFDIWDLFDSYNLKDYKDATLKQYGSNKDVLALIDKIMFLLVELKENQNE